MVVIIIVVMERFKQFNVWALFTLVFALMYYLDSLKNGDIGFKNSIIPTGDSENESDYDFKLVVVNNNNNKQTNFLTHKYILTTNSDYFKTLLSTNESIDNITFYNVSVDTFRYITDLMYHNKFMSPLPLNLLPEVTYYMNKFKILDKHYKYIDKTVANNIRYSDISHINNIAENIYPKIKQLELPVAQDAFLNKIYTDWRKQAMFNVTFIKHYPELFYDYVKKLDC